MAAMGTRQQLAKLNLDALSAELPTMSFSQVVRDLGVLLDSNYEEDVALTVVDVGLRWDLNYESAMDRRSEYLFRCLGGQMPWQRYLRPGCYPGRVAARAS